MAFGDIWASPVCPLIFYIMYTIIKVFVWFICFMGIVEVCASMMSKPNTIEALIGVAIVILFLILSWKTLFFTKIHNPFNKSKKEEK